MLLLFFVLVSGQETNYEYLQICLRYFFFRISIKYGHYECVSDKTGVFLQCSHQNSYPKCERATLKVKIRGDELSGRAMQALIAIRLGNKKLQNNHITKCWG